MISRLSSHRQTQGFSLLELLIAMTIMGFILTLLFSGFRLASTSWDSAERHMDDNAQLQIGQSFLRNMLTQAYPHFWSKLPDRRVAFIGTPNSMHFIAELPSHLSKGGFQQIFLNATQNEEKIELVFRRSDLKSSDTAFSQGEDDSARVVIGNAKEIVFSYFGPESIDTIPEGPSRWSGEWNHPKQLPKLIRIHISTALEWPDLLISPLISQEGNCRWDDFYKRCVGQ
jgi:general secretion pathway protein J